MIDRLYFVCVLVHSWNDPRHEAAVMYEPGKPRCWSDLDAAKEYAHGLCVDVDCGLVAVVMRHHAGYAIAYSFDGWIPAEQITAMGRLMPSVSDLVCDACALVEKLDVASLYKMGE